MRILVVSTVPYGKNGITNVILNNYMFLNKEVFHMDFVFQNEPDRYNQNIFKGNKSEVYILQNRSKRLIQYISELNKIIKNGSYDAIHVHGNSTTLAIELCIAKLNNIDIRIPHAHNTFTKYPTVHKYMRKLFDKSYTKGFACSNAAGSFMFENNNYNIIPNGIVVEDYKFDQDKRWKIREKLNLDESHLVIGNVGRLSQEKNQAYLIYLLNDLLQLNKNYRLLLIGDGELKKYYQSLVDKLDLSNYVLFTGNVDDVNSYLQGMDIYVSSSINEGLPLSLIEAQAADLRCFSTENIDKDVNVSEKLVFYNLDNKNELIEKIENHFKKPNKRENMEQLEIILASEYNIINSVRQMEQLYKSL